MHEQPRGRTPPSPIDAPCGTRASGRGAAIRNGAKRGARGGQFAEVTHAARGTNERRARLDARRDGAGKGLASLTRETGAGGGGGGGGRDARECLRWKLWGSPCGE